jgi:hypothetical protein
MMNTKWGSVGEGWRPIVQQLIAYCEQHGVEIAQIKEKFGGLRFYTDTLPRGLKDLIEDAERESFTVCEDCGAPGTLGGTRYLRTLCPTCRSEAPR